MRLRSDAYSTHGKVRSARFGTPANAVVLARATDFPDDYAVLEIEEHANAVPPVDLGPPVRADMVLLEHANGGAAFSVGSIGWTGSLPINGFDNSIARITSNVLERFLLGDPLALGTFNSARTDRESQTNVNQRGKELENE